MWNEPSDIELRRLPGLYATEHVPLSEKLIHEHFFLGGSDWYAAEYCPRRRLFFGFVVLNGDRANAEWGYFDLDELRSIVALGGVRVDRDLHWRVRPAGEVGAIADVGGDDQSRMSRHVGGHDVSG